ncbi:cyclin-T1-3-like [Mangifera indica]|uniref:cyclin-T1-3-like n=1 Tax=Mangifera indica TaxID=29780 RepID=UPI001CF9854E|nr:cyclin-T1-3-like [Mangifera indica]
MKFSLRIESWPACVDLYLAVDAVQAEDQEEMGSSSGFAQHCVCGTNPTIFCCSMFLAAKFQKVKLPAQKEKGHPQMLKLLEQDRKQTLPPTHESFTKSTAVAGKMNSSPQSCISDGCFAIRQSSKVAMSENDERSKPPACGRKDICVKEVLPSQTSDSASSSIVEDGEGDSHPRHVESDHDPGCKIISVHDTYRKIDAIRIREALKRRKFDVAANRKFAASINPEIDDGEAWIERELEKGIELESGSSKRKWGKSCEFLIH